jgi:predicted nucleotidyltransferase
VLFGSEARAAVLQFLFMRPEEELFLRDIARHCGMAVPPVHRQLQKLQEIGIVESRILGKARAYHLGAGFPGLASLRGLVTALAGVQWLLTEAMQALAVDVAFVFGSVATGSERPGSDVDLFVIGSVNGSDLLDALRPVEMHLGREINPVYCTAAEFQARMSDPSAFLDHVVSSPKLFIKGDDDALRELAGG